MNLKKMMFQLLAILAVLALALRVFVKPSAALTAAKPASHEASYAAVDAYLERQMRRLNIPGISLAVVEGDQIVHMRGFGRARPGGEVPTPQTPFFIGSLTKSFTALAVMQLVEAGQIELDAPVQRYLPWFRLADPQAAAQMTVRHLLNQTSGFSTWSGWTPLADFADDPLAAERLVRDLASDELARPVGSAYEYSNMNYNILGLIIEAASGQPYEAVLQKQILDPLGMRHSCFSQAEAKQNGLAMGHQYWFWLPWRAPNLAVPRGSLASGQLISSAEDMARYLIPYLNGGRSGSTQLLSSAGIAEMQRGAADIEEMGISIGQYGMGWIRSEEGDTVSVWHSGNVPDFSAFMALLPEQKKGVVLLINADHFLFNPVLTELGMDVTGLLSSHPSGPSSMGLSFVDIVPWLVRALLLIPLLQITEAVFTLRRLRGWRQYPADRPTGARLWGLHILLPLIPNLALAAAPLYLLAYKRLGFLLLFAPDFSWIVLLSGVFSGLWAGLRTALMLRAR